MTALLLSLMAACERRQDKIEHNHPCEPGYAIYGNERYGRKEYYITAEVVTQSEILELKGEHLHARHHRQRYQYDKQHHYPVARVHAV